MFALTPNKTLDIFCIIATVFVALYNYLCIKNSRKGTNYVFFVFFILLFSLFYRPENGDFWHYYESYESDLANNMEDFYNWLIYIVPNNFIVWRVLIWLPAALLIMFSFKIMKTPSNLATLLFLMFGLVNAYYYTRNVLGLSVLYLAMTLYCMPKKSYIFLKFGSFINLILLVGLIAASWFLHKSMPLYIGLAVIAMFAPLNRNMIVISLVFFAVLYLLALTVSTNFLQLNVWLSEGVGVGYLEAENTFSANLYGVIMLIVRYIPMVYFYIVAFKYPISKELREYPFFKTFLLLSFFIFYLSFLFLGQGSASLQGRLYKSSMIPFVFALCLYFKNNLQSKRFKVFISLMLLYYALSIFVGIVTQ